MPAPPPPEQAPQETESIALGRFDGLKNTVKRERLSARDLARAINIDLDDDGQIHRRRGTTKVASGEFHSLFQANNSVAYGVMNGDLGVINPDYSFDLLRMGVGGDYNNGEPAVAYVQVGPSIYFSSTSSSGVIDTTTNVIGDWGKSQDTWLSPVVNPTATLPEVGGKLIGRPPLATSLAYFKGRIYLAQGRSLWATELYLYQFVDKTRNFFTYESEIVFVGSVSDGLYIGTSDGVYFMMGEFPQRRIKIMDSPALPGSLVYVPGELANPPQVGLQADEPTSVSIGFMTTTGFCVGSEGGHAINLTESRVFFPKAQRAATLFRRQDGFNQYITVTDHEGTPASSAAIGDYVDAVIIRNPIMTLPVTAPPPLPYPPPTTTPPTTTPPTSTGTGEIIDEFIAGASGALTKNYSTALPAIVFVYVNGVLQLDTDYSVSGSTLHLNASMGIENGDEITITT